MNRVGLLLAVVVAAHGTVGCGVVRSFINTQPVVEHAAADYRTPEAIVGAHATVYRPEIDASVPLRERDLLSRFAPVLVQGTLAPGADDYPVASDAIGTPRLTRSADAGFSVAIDTAQPAMFARMEHQIVKGRELPALVYVFWFPRRPAGSVQQGEVDGGVLRVTLDAAGRRAIYEYSQTCGCLHGVFVGESVEAWAAEEFQRPEDGKLRCSEHDVDGKKDWVVRDLVFGLDPAARPVLFVSAGAHECVAIQTTELVRNLTGFAASAYELRPYDELTRLPVAGEVETHASLFNADGLVWGGKRGREEVLFADLDHPGWPRHLDHMKISWDESDWRDPGLLDRFLRLPSRMIEAEATTESAPVPPAGASAEASAPLPAPVRDALHRGKPVAILVTHKLCGGCRKVEREVLPTPEVRQAQQGWTWLDARLNEPGGEEIGAHFRVDMTPTLILLDRDGSVRQRINGIARVEQFVQALANPAGK